MRRTVLLIGLLFSCARPPVTPPPTTSTVPPEVPPPVATPADELSPVPAPAELEAEVTLRHPGDLVALVLGSQFGNAAISGVALGVEASDALDLDQPLHAAFASDGGRRTLAVSIALAPEVQAKEALERHFDLVRDKSRVRLRPKKSASMTQERACHVVPAASSPGPRIVCATDGKALDKLGPYLTRTVPRATGAAAVHLEVRPRFFQRGEREEEPPVDRDDTDRFFDQLFDTALKDLEGLSLDADMAGPNLDVRVRLTLASRSMLTRAVLSRAQASGPPPSIFYRLPGDALLAFSSRGAAEGDLRPLRAALFAELPRWAASDGYDARASARFAAALEKVVLSGGPIVGAGGFDVASARSALSAYVQGSDQGDGARAKAALALRGYWMVGVEEPAAKWIDAAREYVSLEDAPHKPRPKKADDPPERASHKIRAVPAPAFPRGTFHVEWKTIPNPAYAKAVEKAVSAGDYLPEAALPSTVHLVVVPDGPRTWIGVAEDMPLLLSRVKSAIDAKDTLAARPELKSVAPGHALFLGTMSGVSRLGVSDASSHGALVAAEMTLRELESKADKGTTPILVLLDHDPAHPAQARALTAHARVPLSVFQQAPFASLLGGP